MFHSVTAPRDQDTACKSNEQLVERGWIDGSD